MKFPNAPAKAPTPITEVSLGGHLKYIVHTDFVAQAFAMKSAADGVRGTNTAVEIGGVRIEACDENGNTATTKELAGVKESERKWHRLYDRAAETLRTAKAGLESKTEEARQLRVMLRAANDRADDMQRQRDKERQRYEATQRPTETLVAGGYTFGPAEDRKFRRFVFHDSAPSPAPAMCAHPLAASLQREVSVLEERLGRSQRDASNLRDANSVLRSAVLKAEAATSDMRKKKDEWKRNCFSALFGGSPNVSLEAGDTVSLAPGSIKLTFS